MFSVKNVMRVGMKILLIKELAEDAERLKLSIKYYYSYDKHACFLIYCELEATL